MMLYEVKVGERVFKFHGSSTETAEYAKRLAKALGVSMDRVLVKLAR